MGHIRLGRLPKTRDWVGVFDTLQNDSTNTAALAKSAVIAAQAQFSDLERNSAINYCFWVLVRLATAGRSDNFVGELEKLGVQQKAISSGLQFVQLVSRTVEKELRGRSQSSVFVRMAELSLREVLSANIIEQSNSLFGTSLSEIQAACRTISTTKNFGRVAKEFYATLLSRSIQFIIDKELSNYVGPSGSTGSPWQVLDFQRSLKVYCFESAKIVEDFASGWFSKNNWDSNNDISEDAAKAFTAYAIQKIQMELRGAKI